MSGAEIGDGAKHQQGKDPAEPTGASDPLFSSEAALPTGERAANPRREIQIDLTDYYRRANAIASFILKVANENHWIQDRTSQGINPCHDQVESNGAMALEMYYGMPSTLHTPLGRVEFAGSGQGDFNDVMELLTERFGLEEIVPVTQTDNGAFGPIYRITKDLEGNELPEVIYAKKADFIGYDNARALWEDVKPHR